MNQIVEQLDKNYERRIERGVMNDVPYISTRHIDPIGNPVWGETCLKNKNPKMFAELEEAMEKAA